MKKELTEEELIELAKQTPEAKFTSVEFAEIEQFIKDYSIEASTHKTNTQFIYWGYRTWCRDTKRKPMPSRKFFFQFKHYFKSCGKLRYISAYYVNPEPFHLEDGSPEWWDMKKFFRDKREIKKRMSPKKKQTKESPVSESTEEIHE